MASGQPNCVFASEIHLCIRDTAGTFVNKPSMLARLSLSCNVQFALHIHCQSVQWMRAISGVTIHRGRLIRRLKRQRYNLLHAMLTICPETLTVWSGINAGIIAGIRIQNACFRSV